MHKLEFSYGKKIIECAYDTMKIFDLIIDYWLVKLKPQSEIVERIVERIVDNKIL